MVIIFLKPSINIITRVYDEIKRKKRKEKDERFTQNRLFVSFVLLRIVKQRQCVRLIVFSELSITALIKAFIPVPKRV